MTRVGWRTPGPRWLLRGLLWVAGANLLLVGGFLFFVWAAGRLAADEETRQVLAIYARVVLLKGLLPQLWLSLALWPLLRRLPVFAAPGRLRVALAIAVSALLSGLVVASMLLPAETPDLPTVVFRGPGNFVATVLEMSAAVTAASLLPKLLLCRFQRPESGARH